MRKHDTLDRPGQDASPLGQARPRSRGWNGCGIPCAMNAPGGFPYSGDDPDGFMTRAEVVSHLEQHASSFGASMCYDQRVTAVDPSPEGKGYLVSTADGAGFTAPIVVVATGSFPFPGPSPFSGEGRRSQEVWTGALAGFSIRPAGKPTRHGPGRPGGNMATKRNARPWCNVVGGLVP